MNLQNNTHTDLDQSVEVYKFVLKGACILMFALFVLYDGFTTPQTFTTKLFTIPFFICGIALIRNLSHALQTNHHAHSTLFTIGLITLAALT